MTSVTLSVENVFFSYSANPVLIGCKLHIAPGEILGIIGRNGAGKTTLMKLISGQLQPKHGSILIGGAVPDSKQARLDTLYAASNDYLPTFMTGNEYLRMLAALYGVPADQSLFEALFAEYGMAHRGSHLIEDYSHGM